MSLKHIKEVYTEKAVPLFKKEYGIKSVLAVPRIQKVIINVGVGRVKEEKEKEDVRTFLQMITGQVPQSRPARIAIASFKTRKGSLIGYRVTLRGKRMYDFLERFMWVAIPRMRDFRGIGRNSVDEHGNLHVGIREHIVFPEMIGEDVRRIFSLQVTVVTTAGTKEKAEKLFTTLGFPLAKS